MLNVLEIRIGLPFHDMPIAFNSQFSAAQIPDDGRNMATHKLHALLTITKINFQLCATVVKDAIHYKQAVVNLKWGWLEVGSAPTCSGLIGPLCDFEHNLVKNYHAQHIVRPDIMHAGGAYSAPAHSAVEPRAVLWKRINWWWKRILAMYKNARQKCIKTHEKTEQKRMRNVQVEQN